MICNKCKETIDEDSKFCPHCGNKIEEEKSSKNKEKIKSKNKDSLWDKFAEIYDSSGEDRKIYEDLSSNEVWELIRRISSNGFETFIQNNKDLLNKQPYRVIETLKNVFGWCASGGYWFWMAEELLKNGDLKIPKDINLDNFIKEWQVTIGKDYTKISKDFTDELSISMSRFFEYEFKTVIDSADSVKDMPNEFIENFRTSLMIQIIWGYLGGVSENKYRK